MHRSVKENVIDRLGAPVTTFAHLKLGDARGDGRKGYNAKIRATAAGVRKAANAIGVARLELKNESFNQPPDCPNYPHYANRSECPGCFIDSSDHQQSLLGQLEGRAKCYEMLKDHEAREAADFSFDWVLYARADITWYDAVSPWCRHGLPKRFADWVFLLERKEAERNLWQPWADHYACKTPPEKRDNVEKFTSKHSRLMSYPDARVTLPALVTRFARPGFPLNMDQDCTGRMAKCSQDHHLKGADRCIMETSSNVCNAPP